MGKIPGVGFLQAGFPLHILAVPQWSMHTKGSQALAESLSGGKGDVYETNLSFNELVQYMFSGGMIFPDHLEKRPLSELSAEPPPVPTP